MISGRGIPPEKRLGRRALRRILSIQGMVSREEVEMLEELAAGVDPSACIVEVGSYRGRSTAALAAGASLGSGADIFAIEPHEPFTGILGGTFGPDDRKAFFRNAIKGETWERVRLVNLSSEIVVPGWKRPVGLLWIDGDHTFEGVTRDFEAWRRFVVPGGVVAFHDATDPELGPARLIAELVGGDDFEPNVNVGELVALRRVI
jgi:hypothetical protein